MIIIVPVEFLITSEKYLHSHFVFHGRAQLNRFKISENSIVKHFICNLIAVILVSLHEFLLAQKKLLVKIYVGHSHPSIVAIAKL